jgi:hypothetical protein
MTHQFSEADGNLHFLGLKKRSNGNITSSTKLKEIHLSSACPHYFTVSAISLKLEFNAVIE